jgi:hypothetical protein
MAHVRRKEPSTLHVQLHSTQSGSKIEWANKDLQAGIAVFGKDHGTGRDVQSATPHEPGRVQVGVPTVQKSGALVLRTAMARVLATDDCRSVVRSPNRVI